MPEKKMTIEELKEMIVDLRMDLVKANIPSGHCPCVYYHLPEFDREKIDCNEINCDQCHSNFMDTMRKYIEKEVAQL